MQVGVDDRADRQRGVEGLAVGGERQDHRPRAGANAAEPHPAHLDEVLAGVAAPGDEPAVGVPGPMPRHRPCGPASHTPRRRRRRASLGSCGTRWPAWARRCRTPISASTCSCHSGSAPTRPASRRTRLARAPARASVSRRASSSHVAKRPMLGSARPARRRSSSQRSSSTSPPTSRSTRSLRDVSLESATGSACRLRTAVVVVERRLAGRRRPRSRWPPGGLGRPAMLTIDPAGDGMSARRRWRRGRAPRARAGRRRACTGGRGSGTCTSTRRRRGRPRRRRARRPNRGSGPTALARWCPPATTATARPPPRRHRTAPTSRRRRRPARSPTRSAADQRSSPRRRYRSPVTAVGGGGAELTGRSCTPHGDRRLRDGVPRRAAGQDDDRHDRALVAVPSTAGGVDRRGDGPHPADGHRRHRSTAASPASGASRAVRRVRTVRRRRRRALAQPGRGRRSQTRRSPIDLAEDESSAPTAVRPAHRRHRVRHRVRRRVG